MDVTAIRHSNLLALVEALNKRGIIKRMDQAQALGGLGSSFLSQLVGGKKMGDDVARKIEAAAEKPHGWLDRVHGDFAGRVGEEPPSPYLRPISVWNDPSDLPPESTVLLPKLDYFLSAGKGGPDPNAVERTDKSLPFSASWAKSKGWSPRTHYTMRASGQSMEPTIQHNAPVVIDTSDSAKAIRSGKVYALLIDREPLLKRLVKLPNGRVQVQSDNPAREYAAYEVTEDDVHVIGRAVWTPSEL